MPRARNLGAAQGEGLPAGRAAAAGWLLLLLLPPSTALLFRVCQPDTGNIRKPRDL